MVFKEQDGFRRKEAVFTNELPGLLSSIFFLQTAKCGQQTAPIKSPEIFAWKTDMKPI